MPLALRLLKMTAKITKEIIKEAKLRYLELGDSKYFSAPQIYSPLYRQLYDNLNKKEQPPLPENINLQSIKADIKLCNNPFDRYLVAFYPSRFEVSNPLAIKEEPAVKVRLIAYLEKQYGKDSKDPDSYNMDRKKKDLLRLLTPFQKEKFNKISQSTLYKLLTLSYKLSKVNTQWPRTIERMTSAKASKASMDNIVPFNDVDSSKAQENTLLFMMMFYELDQGKPDGDDNFSRLICVIPFALDLLDRYIEEEVKELWDDLYDPIEIEKEIINRFELNLDHRLRTYSEPSPSLYSNINHEFYDLLQASMLKNHIHNIIIAKMFFEQTIVKDQLWVRAFSDYSSYKIKNWVYKKLTDDERCFHVENSLQMVLKDERISLIKIASIVSSLIEKRFPKAKRELVDNVTLLVVYALKYNWPKEITGSVQGEKKKSYHCFNHLKKVVNKIEEKNIPEQHWETLLRPSLIHFIQYCIHLKLSLLDGTVKNLEHFNKLRQLSYMIKEKVSDRLKETHHYDLLNIVESYALAPNMELKELLKMYWSDIDPNLESFKEHIQRKKLKWEPIIDIKEKS